MSFTVLDAWRKDESEEECETCRKYPFLPRCKKYANLTIKEVFTNPKYETVVERAFERLKQAFESGIVSEKKIPRTITEDEYKFHEQRVNGVDELEAMQSRNVLSSVFAGKTKVVKM